MRLSLLPVTAGSCRPASTGSAVAIIKSIRYVSSVQKCNISRRARQFPGNTEAKGNLSVKLYVLHLLGTLKKLSLAVLVPGGSSWRANASEKNSDKHYVEEEIRDHRKMEQIKMEEEVEADQEMVEEKKPVLEEEEEEEEVKIEQVQIEKEPLKAEAEGEEVNSKKKLEEELKAEKKMEEADVRVEEQMEEKLEEEVFTGHYSVTECQGHSPQDEASQSAQGDEAEPVDLSSPQQDNDQSRMKMKREKKGANKRPSRKNAKASPVTVKHTKDTPPLNLREFLVFKISKRYSSCWPCYGLLWLDIQPPSQTIYELGKTIRKWKGPANHPTCSKDNLKPDVPCQTKDGWLALLSNKPHEFEGNISFKRENMDCSKLNFSESKSMDRQSGQMNLTTPAAGQMNLTTPATGQMNLTTPAAAVLFGLLVLLGIHRYCENPNGVCQKTEDNGIV
ncbi:hypothetical protein JZ751_018883 [Albula glossodonta]|uniref:Uncharacterized protein n=1 Tax=Albula glossodonta TaxID=121402 RepID=A0A8T2N1B3_9TELE|nr:hypothetical protein JZ751_018883 [Albula glossodonta]